MKCMVQEAKSPVKILSGSVAQRDLILVLKDYTAFLIQQNPKFISECKQSTPCKWHRARKEKRSETVCKSEIFRNP
jgi:hypothetical protein